MTLAIEISAYPEAWPVHLLRLRLAGEHRGQALHGLPLPSTYHRLVDAVLRRRLRRRPARPAAFQRAAFASNPAVHRVRLPVVRIRPSRRRIELNRLSELQGPPQGAWMDSLAATSAILRPWYRAPASSFSEGCLDPSPAIVVAP